MTPVTEWIQPEIAVPGAEQGAYRFQDIRGLVQGDFENGKQYGALSPFPGSNPPAPSACSSPPAATPTPTPTPGSPAPVNGPVAAIAAVANPVRIGVQVLLAASNTNTAVSSTDLAFTWIQLSPTASSVSITNPAAATASVIGPKTAVEVSYVFEVTVSLKSDPTQKSKANVTVTYNPTMNDAVTVNTYSWDSKNSGTIGVTCSSNVINGDNKKMSLLLNSGATTVSMTNTAAGKWQYSSTKVKQPTNIQCVSDLGGKSDLVTAPRRKKRGIHLGSVITF